MTILIVENEPFVLEDIKSKLNQLGYTKLIDTDNVNDAVAMLKKDKPNVALVDIELNGIKDGIDLGKILHENAIPFIYMSQLQDIETFNRAKKTHPQSNIPKPLTILQLRNALLEINNKSQVKTKQNFIIVPQKDQKIRVNKSDILYLKAARNHCDIYLNTEERFTSSVPMKHVIEILDQDNFIQIHKSYCINIDFVERYWGNQVFLKRKNEPIIMSDTFKSNFTDKMDVV